LRHVGDRDGAAAGFDCGAAGVGRNGDAWGNGDTWRDGCARGQTGQGDCTIGGGGAASGYFESGEPRGGHRPPGRDELGREAAAGSHCAGIGPDPWGGTDIGRRRRTGISVGSEIGRWRQIRVQGR